MKTNVEALKALYLKLGGSLTDTYSDIAGGIPVGEYDLISDCILACAKKGGGGSDLPSMTGQSGKYLTNNGTAASWGDVSALPSMTEQSGKFLTNNGTAASWGDVPSGDKDYTVVLTVVNPGDPNPEYAATLDGESVTLAELLTLAAANAPLRVVAPIDSGFVSAPVTNWKNDAMSFTAPIIVGGSTVATALAACTNDGTGDEWTVTTV